MSTKNTAPESVAPLTVQEQDASSTVLAAKQQPLTIQQLAALDGDRWKTASAVLGRPKGNNNMPEPGTRYRLKNKMYGLAAGTIVVFIRPHGQSGRSRSCGLFAAEGEHLQKVLRLERGVGTYYLNFTPERGQLERIEDAPATKADSGVQESKSPAPPPVDDKDNFKTKKSA